MYRRPNTSGGIGAMLPPVPRGIADRPGSSQSSTIRQKSSASASRMNTSIGPFARKKVNGGPLGRSKSAMGRKRGSVSNVNVLNSLSRGGGLRVMAQSKSMSKGYTGMAATRSSERLSRSASNGSVQTLPSSAAQMQLATFSRLSDHLLSNDGRSGRKTQEGNSVNKLGVIGGDGLIASAMSSARSSAAESVSTSHSDEEEDRMLTHKNNVKDDINSRHDSEVFTSGIDLAQHMGISGGDAKNLLPATSLATLLLGENSLSDLTPSCSNAASSESEGDCGSDDGNSTARALSQPQPQNSHTQDLHKSKIRRSITSVRRGASSRPTTSHAAVSGSRNPMFRMDTTSSLSTGSFAQHNRNANNRRPNTAPQNNNSNQQNNASPSKEDLRRDNQILRAQVERMRSQSLNAVRGGKRFVSGGGFRASRNTDQNNLGGNVRSSKRGLEHLRNQVRQLTSEKQDLAQKLADTNMRLNRCIQNQKALYNQVKAVETDRDRLSETISQRERLIEDQSSRLSSQLEVIELSKSRERVLLEEIEHLKMKLEVALQASKKNDTISDHSEEIAILKQDVERLTEALAAANRSGSTEKEHIRDLEVKLKNALLEVSSKNMQLVEARQEAREATASKEVAENSAKELRKKLDKSEANNSTLNSENQRLQEEIAALKKAMDDAKSIQGSRKGKEAALRKEIERLENELEETKRLQNGLLSKVDNLRGERDALKESSATLSMKLVSEQQLREAECERANQAEASRTTLEKELQRLREALAALEREMSAKDKELFRLRKLAKSGMSNAGDLKSDIEKLKNKLGVSEAECKAVREQLDSMMQRARDAEMAMNKKSAAFKLMEAELRRCEKDLGMEQSVTEKLRNELAEAAKRLANVKADTSKATQQARKEALESSLQSMVRLCVVAPTVNVHFNSQEHACKAPMPSSRIRGIIENDVLPNFSSLFIQLEEGKAQDGSKLDQWLEGMLAEMQRSIQSHLADVFNDQNGGNNSNAYQNRAGGRPVSSQSGRAKQRMGVNRGGRRPATRAG